MSEPKALNAPERIYLQAGEPIDGVPFGALAEVTWCQDLVGDHDVAYVRADLRAAEVGRLQARATELEAAARALVNHLWTAPEPVTSGELIRLLRALGDALDSKPLGTVSAEKEAGPGA